MIVVKLELWPGGNQSKKIGLGSAKIHNAGRVGDNGLCRYGVRLLKGEKFSGRAGEVYREGEVPAFPRRDKRFGPWELLALALEATVGDRVRRLQKSLEADG